MFYVGLPDSQDQICWLAGYKSDPTRYYTFEGAIKFKSAAAAQSGVIRAMKTHPFQKREYIIFTEMDRIAN